MKSKLISVAVLFFATCLGCGKDTPLETGPPVTKTPELMPLAEGASWEYRYYYYYGRKVETPYGTDFYTEQLTGQYTLTIKEQQIYPDSTLYLIDAVTEPDTGGGGGVVRWQVLYKSDTLLYKQEQEWRYMMPSEFIPSGYIDILIFLPPIGSRYDLEMGTEYGYHVDYGLSNHRYSKWYCESSSNVSIDSTGVSSVNIYWCDFSRASMIKRIWQVSYTPGTQ